jgi:hypothetical protein
MSRADELAAEQKRLVLIEFERNRRVAHEVLFKHRHPLKTPAFHHRMIDAFHGPQPKVILEAFRDAAKSTVAEEGIIVKALLREFKNAVIIGSSFLRARERLGSVKAELENNRAIEQLFGPPVGDQWGEGRIVLRNGVCIQALGVGMSMRGTKYHDARPDFGLIDDIEDEESVKSPEERDKLLFWLYRTFLPAMSTEPPAHVRFLGNRLDTDALIVRISREKTWRHLQFPVMGQDEAGEERADLLPGRWAPLWSEKFPLDLIAEKLGEYDRLGLHHAFMCEYMCQADDPGSRLFDTNQFKQSTHTRTWEAVYAAYDPARTTNARSATTGKAVFSWVRNRLVVWEGSAHLWLPDEIVDDILAVDRKYAPAEVGVEATGLEEFIMQPLRHAAITRRQLLPLRRLIPPRGKTTFIRGLQPFFKAGEVEFVNVSDEAKAQLLAFPTGRNDFPNALAYALHMRPGQPVFDGFNRDHVAAQLHRLRSPWWLALNATGQYTVGVLIQVDMGQVRVYADWAREGHPGETLDDILVQARLEAGQPVKLVAPPVPHGRVDTVGLRVAASASQMRVQNGGPLVKGRQELARLMDARRREEPQLLIDHDCRWTLNGFAGGYAYDVDTHGRLTDRAVANVYKVVMEALESFAAGLHATGADEDDDARYAVSSDGRPYKTILPARTG